MQEVRELLKKLKASENKIEKVTFGLSYTKDEISIIKKKNRKILFNQYNKEWAELKELKNKNKQELNLYNEIVKLCGE